MAYKKKAIQHKKEAKLLKEHPERFSTMPIHRRSRHPLRARRQAKHHPRTL